MATYSRTAGKKVETAMREMKEGKLKSGRSGKKVTNPKQAIAIALSEARERGAKVPAKKSAAKGSAAKSSASKAGGKRAGASTKMAAKAGRKTAGKTTTKTAA